jgi:hypothetical protein
VPEMLTDDEIREAFARLRADELPRVAGPGSAAAHRTVRRRRATARAAVLITALAVAGGAAFTVGTSTPRPAPPPPVLPAASAAPSPVPTRPDLVRLGEQASLALDRVVPGDYYAAGSGPLDGGFWYEYEETIPAGSHRLTGACVGRGKARFEIVQNQHAEGFDLVCDGRARSLEFVYQPTFTLYVSIEPDATADGHAGFAYAVDDVR